jgi:hypothetical protein
MHGVVYAGAYITLCMFSMVLRACVQSSGESALRHLNVNCAHFQ